MRASAKTGARVERKPLSTSLIYVPESGRIGAIMKKPTLKRLLLGAIQHICAVGMAVVIAILIMNGTVKVENMNLETKTYGIDPFENAASFEDSSVFNRMLNDAIRDITRLVVIKSQMETDGVFDPNKVIDITEFVNRKGMVSNCTVKAEYALEDLLKWGKYGIQRMEQKMPKEEFVTYFDKDIIRADNFYLDGEGQLQFKGFMTDEGNGNESYKVIIESNASAEVDVSQAETDYSSAGLDNEKVKLLDTQVSFEKYGYDELVDIVFRYYANETGQNFTLYIDEAGVEYMQFSTIQSRYNTADGYGRLIGLPDNWIDYFMLENNLEETINGLAYNYNQYQEQNELYSYNNTNIRYYFRIQSEDGEDAFTNVQEDFTGVNEDTLKDYFAAMGRYLIYSPAEMDSLSNLNISTEELYNLLGSYQYVYPETTKIWIGVDTAYERVDQFATAFGSYSEIVSKFTQWLAIMAVCGIVWLGIWIYLTVTAGRANIERADIGTADMESADIGTDAFLEVIKPVKQKNLYLNAFDKIHTEIVLAMSWVLCILGIWGINYLKYNLYFDSYLYSSSYVDTRNSQITINIWVSAAYGFLASFSFCSMWYSLIRRLKSRNLWKDSLLNMVLQGLTKGTAAVANHHSVAVRVLLPYALYLLVNMTGVFIFCYFMEYRMERWILFPVIGVLIFDGWAGVALFRRNMERSQIVDGISKIREGNIDFKLDSTSLHGENKEFAEAVNNIGEGIRKAVETSMKDERMKTDLITNVSHDIKTPLTSIINYVDLLKREKIQTEPVRSYIEVLESKSQRLKQLTDDLVEASKISSGNIVLIREKLNLSELVNQSIGEFSEKLDAKNLMVIFNQPEAPAYIFADSRRMWRVVENLFNNICKYAMPGTRIYIDMNEVNDQIDVSIKNISELPLNISPDELTERFIRGDVSRTTEGSGLGLSIAKSLTEVQGGSFQIFLDGDLFKVVLKFPQYRELSQE